jgi:transposase
MKLETLPDSIDELKQLLLKTVQENNQVILSKDNEIQTLKDVILLLQRKKFAPSSEKITDQIDMFNEVESIELKNSNDSDDTQDDENTETITYERKKGKRAPLPPSLPREDIILDIPESEKVGMKYIGDEISEQLHITPAKVVVKRTIRKKYAPIDSTSDSKFKMEPLPPQLLPKSMATASLIAYIITAKYVDAMPLYRQEKIFSRIHADINRQTMARWLIKVSDQLVPLYNLLQEKLLDKNYIQFDETTVQVLKENGKKATSKSYMLVRHAPGDSPIVLFDYAPTRSGEVPIELLTGFKGYLQVDGYDGYNRACEEYKLTRFGCWDHCRRKFFDAFKTSKGKGHGQHAIKIIKKLYDIEDKIKTLSPDKKLVARQSEAAPILVEFKVWIDGLRGKVTPKSTSGKAIHYAYNEWKYLTVYIEDGNLNISNIWVENAIRPFCVGKKNWLFSASVEGAKASAMFYSLIETAKKNNFEPFDYLSRMLDKLPLAKTVEDYERLLPLKGQFLA